MEWLEIVLMDYKWWWIFFFQKKYTIAPVDFFLWKKLAILLFKIPNQCGQGNILEFFPKIGHISRKIYEITKTLGRSGQIYGFLFLKLQYLANKF